MKVMTSRAFNQDVSEAKRGARLEPVFVTDRGRATHVLLNIDTFRQLTGPAESLADLLAMPESVRREPDWHGADVWIGKAGG